ncbi:4'-phosphopantetheinyl transferase family protein [Streptomyces alboniger]|uniref:4'-phosphopantetheinyl transferase superfamily protein n=1 Tax=Streptomyces alboniger TaxID=132473 RepID=A0A5J6HQZ5_STRAD|nr:4'-phosphopantetheinyl transferase superfamily protein [Streptomyces alboniger]QEV20761.1 4'-phosphopantetheinyl transferase superfamily protein [Streptomyces alboniger]
MISQLLPKTVVCAEAYEDGESPETALYPEEAALVASSVPGRRAEFATVRACARRALAGLGLPPSPVLPGVRNVPQWPKGVVGSMTHCAGYRAAALAKADDVLAVGIDAEPDGPLPDGVLEAIALPREAAWALAPGTAGPVHRDRLLFSAKECVYKTWFPLIRREIDFDDAEITFSDAAGSSGTFSARILRPGRLPDGGPLTGFTGRWLARDGLLVTAIALEAKGPARS